MVRRTKTFPKKGPQSFESLFLYWFPPSVLVGWLGPSPSMHFLSPQVGGNLESSCSGYDRLVVNGVFHGAEAVADRVLDLSGNEKRGGEGGGGQRPIAL